MKSFHCPSRQELSAYAVGLLEEGRSHEIDSHLSACDRCQAALDTVHSRSDSLLAGLRTRESSDAFTDEPECNSALARIAQFGRHEAPQTLVLRPEELAPELGQLGPYQLVEKLGQGGMGTVYKAFHRKLKRLVAVKVLPADKMCDQGAVARFEREMEAVGKLVHPNIVMAHDAGEIDGKHFLVMEYVEGVDLSQLVARCGPLPIADACELVRQAAIGLAHAHAHGLVHRDIKPGNLILAVGDHITVKILDLGLALLAQASAGDDRELTATGQVMGTLDYMAPEQGGDSHVVDPRADVYALGATLYKLLTGHAIYHGAKYATAVQKMTALALQPAPPIQQRRSEVPAELAAIVHRMIAKRPSDRISTATEVAELLAPFAQQAKLSALCRRAMGDGPGVAEPASPSRITKHEDAPSLRDTANMPRARVDGALPVAARPLPVTKPLLVAEPLDPPLPPPIAPVPPPVAKQPRVAAKFLARRRFPFWVYPVAAGLMTLLVFGALVALIKLRTPHGEVVVELGEGVQPDDVQVEVRSGGDLSIIDAQRNWTVDIREGQYEVAVTGDGRDRLKLDADSITVQRGKKTHLRVSLRPFPAPVEPPPAQPRPLTEQLAPPSDAHERSAAERVLALGGRVSGNAGGKWWGATTLAALPKTPLEITTIDLSDQKIGEGDWEELQLESLPNLLVLNLAGAALDDDRLRSILNACPTLTTLDLQRTSVSPAAIDEAARRVRFVSWTPPAVAKTIVATSEGKATRWRIASEAPPREWVELGFDDSAWPKIELPLGAVRVRGRTPWTDERVWLRHNFQLEEVPRGRLYLRAYCDDVHEVSLNGAPILRIKPGDVTSLYAMRDLGDAEKLLRTGDNVLAACGTRNHTRAFFDAGLLVLGVDAPAEPPVAPVAAKPAGLVFDGQSSRIELGKLKLDTARPFTIEALLELESPADEAIIASNLSGAGGFRFSINKDGWWSFKWASGRALLGRGGPGKKEGPLHAAAVWDGKDVKVFVDGRSVIAGGGGIPLTDVPAKAVPLMIGAETGPDGKPRRHLAGMLRQLRISSMARYTGPFEAPAALEADDQTLALYEAAGLEGKALRDASSSALHGTALNLHAIGPTIGDGK